MTTIEENLDASDLKIGVVVASWNQSVTDRLLQGALERLRELGATDIVVLRVPGALEIPVGARALIETGCQAVVAIGTVVKGVTDHYEIVVKESSNGVARVATDTGVPVANAILAVHEIEDALERSGGGGANKGAEAARAAVITANAISALERL